MAANGRLTGRRFTVTAQNPNIAVVSIAGAPFTDNAGKGEFSVSEGSTTRAGNATIITVTVDGKSTRWTVSIT